MLKNCWKIPFFTLAWLLHGLSDWSYDAASWLYRKAGTAIFEASITYDDER